MDLDVGKGCGHRSQGESPQDITHFTRGISHTGCSWGQGSRRQSHPPRETYQTKNKIKPGWVHCISGFRRHFLGGRALLTRRKENHQGQRGKTGWWWVGGGWGGAWRPLVDSQPEETSTSIFTGEEGNEEGLGDALGLLFIYLP